MSSTTSPAPQDSRYRGAGGRRSRLRPAVVKNAVAQVLRTAPASVQDDFVRAISGDEDALDPALWGPAPSASEQSSAALEMLRREFAARRLVLEQSLTRSEAAELLEVSEQAVLDRLEAGDLLGMKQGRRWRLPAWQFDPDTERGFLPGLGRLSKVYPGGLVSLSQWATSQNADLDGATPASVLKAGDVDRVVALAPLGTSAAW